MVYSLFFMGYFFYASYIGTQNFTLHWKCCLWRREVVVQNTECFIWYPGTQRCGYSYTSKQSPISDFKHGKIYTPYLYMEAKFRMIISLIRITMCIVKKEWKDEIRLPIFVYLQPFLDKLRRYSASWALGKFLNFNAIFVSQYDGIRWTNIPPKSSHQQDFVSVIKTALLSRKKPSTFFSAVYSVVLITNTKCCWCSLFGGV